MHNGTSHNYYDDYARSQAHIVQLQSMLQYVYNGRIFWMRMFWLQSVIAYILLAIN